MKVKESRENLIISSSCLTRAGENFETIEMKSPFIQECEQKRKELFADERKRTSGTRFITTSHAHF